MVALNPDNQFSKAKMLVKSEVRGKCLHVTISRCPSIETMRSTLDDIFRCAKAAQDSVALARYPTARRAIKKDKRFK